jgi:RES domain-containing protein
MVKVYRLCKSKYAATAFDGEGAFQFGGRWNSCGTRMVYTAESLSLAVLEMLVHFQDEAFFTAYCFIEATINKKMIASIENINPLPKNWQASPAPFAVQKIGDDWAKKQSTAVLRVPSAIIATEFNYLINPIHPDFSRIVYGEPQSFVFNERLLK